MYHRGSHKQTHKTPKARSPLTFSRVPTSRYSRRLALGIFLSGPLLAAGLMAAIYSAVGPDPAEKSRSSPLSNQKQPTEEEDPPAPIDIRINGQDVPVPSAGEMRTELPLDQGTASVEVKTEQMTVDPETPLSPEVDASNSSSADVEVQVYGTVESQVEIDISQKSTSPSPDSDREASPGELRRYMQRP